MCANYAEEKLQTIFILYRHDTHKLFTPSSSKKSILSYGVTMWGFTCVNFQFFKEPSRAYNTLLSRQNHVMISRQLRKDAIQAICYHT